MIIKDLYKLSSVLLLVVFNVVSATAQQQFSYTQYMENLVPVNSAYSLLNPQGAVNLVARKQWVGIKGSPSTLIANAYLPLGYESTATAGLIVLHDNIAVENLSEANAFLAKSIQITESGYLSASVNLGVRRYATNYASLDPNDPVLQDDVNEIAGNIGFSVMFYGMDEYEENKYYVGVSMPRMTVRSPKDNSPNKARYFRNQYFLVGGFSKNISDELKIKPAVLVSYTSNVPLQADFSSILYLQNKFGFGLNYRTNNELAGILSVNFNEAIRLGYSYQMGFGTNKLGGINNATHEVGFTYRFGEYY